MKRFLLLFLLPLYLVSQEYVVDLYEFGKIIYQYEGDLCQKITRLSTSGEIKKDIDFTDHGRPKSHPNPHEHRWIPNPTGGTPQRSPKAEPLL